MAISLVQSVAAGNSGDGFGNSISLSSPAIAGNLLVLVVGVRNSGYTPPWYGLSGWTNVGNSLGYDPGTSEVHVKIADGGEQTIATYHAGTGGPASALIAEFSGFGNSINAYVSDSVGVPNGSTTATMPTVTPPENQTGIVLGILWKVIADASSDIQPTGYTTFADSGWAGFGNRCRLYGWFKGVDSTSGAYGGEVTGTLAGHSENYGPLMTIVITSNAPLPCNPRIIDNFNRVVSITSEFESYDRSFYGPVWTADNSIPSGSTGTATIVNYCQMVSHDGYLWFDPTITSWGGSGGFTPTAGNILVFLGNSRGGGAPYTSTALWTVLESASNGTGASVGYKVSNGTETNCDITGNAGQSWFMVEVSGVSYTGITHGLATGTGTLMTGPTVSNSVARSAVTLVMFSGDSGSDQTITPNSPFSQLMHAGSGASSNPCTVGSRTETSATGSNTPSAPWSQSNPWSVAVITLSEGGSTSVYSVDGEEVYLDIDLGGNPGSSHQELLTVPFELWMLNNNDYSMRFKVSTIPDGAGSNHFSEVYYRIQGPANDIIVTCLISSSATYGQLNLNGTAVTKTNWIADEWYTLAIVRQDGVAQLRVWADSETEPTSPQVSKTADFSWALGSDAIFTVWLLWDNIVSTGDNRYKFYVDDIEAGCIETVLVTPPTATFGTYTRDRMLLSIRASFTDDNLYNHALVIATGDKNTTYVSEVRDDDVTSPTRIAAIGDRVFKYETDQISTQDAADSAARKVFLQNCLVSEDIDLEAICNPAFEGNDVVAVQELTFSEINKKFRIRAFTVPLSSSRQVFKLNRVISLV